jgi:hypothetical protein
MVSRARHDPFLERFFARIPREVAASFTDDRLLAVKQAFAAHGEAGYSIDLGAGPPAVRLSAGYSVHSSAAAATSSGRSSSARWPAFGTMRISLLPPIPLAKRAA